MKTFGLNFFEFAKISPFVPRHRLKTPLRLFLTVRRTKSNISDHLFYTHSHLITNMITNALSTLIHKVDNNVLRGTPLKKRLKGVLRR
jgi:hypothetical protein